MILGEVQVLTRPSAAVRVSHRRANSSFRLANQVRIVMASAGVRNTAIFGEGCGCTASVQQMHLRKTKAQQDSNAVAIQSRDRCRAWADATAISLTIPGTAAHAWRICALVMTLRSRLPRSRPLCSQARAGQRPACRQGGLRQDVYGDRKGGRPNQPVHRAAVPQPGRTLSAMRPLPEWL